MRLLALVGLGTLLVAHPAVATVLCPEGGVDPRPAGGVREADEPQFWCPMHPDQRADVPGKCSLCGMALVRMPPASFATNPVDLRATPTLAGVRLRIAVKQPAGSAVVRRFSVVHERPMHLFVVGDGLEFFAHEHPVQQPDGVFMLDLALPRPGPYMAIAEFLPEGGTPQTFQQAFTTGSAFGRAPRLAVDTGPATVDGMRVSLDASTLKAGETQALTIRIDDAATGAAVTDLEPYLGASAHLLVVAADMTEAIHAHPADDVHGPSVAFTPLIPRPGIYKAWIQFQRAGHVSTAAFVIDVP